MSESKADEQQMANSDMASRHRMTDQQWADEAKASVELEDYVEQYDFTQKILNLYKYHYSDSAYIGVEVVKLLNDAADELGKSNRDEFLMESSHG